MKLFNAIIILTLLAVLTFGVNQTSLAVKVTPSDEIVISQAALSGNEELTAIEEKTTPTTNVESVANELPAVPAPAAIATPAPRTAKPMDTIEELVRNSLKSGNWYWFGKSWQVQVAAFNSKQSADSLVLVLQKLTNESVNVLPMSDGKWRVRVGSGRNIADAIVLRDSILAFGFPDAWMATTETK